MDPKFGLVAVGGTFDRFHRGHKAIVKKAFEIGRNVIIGLTSDEMAGKEVEPYELRKKVLVEFLERNGLSKRCDIVKLSDVYGPTLKDERIDAIVVSEETEPKAVEINRIRGKESLSPLEIVVVPFELAEDRRPISSTRIKKGEIDREGRLILWKG
ncbi:MAG: phosphopantetheine adenylyltransferase [Candidatus Hydrothermarchaeales archaeon]